MSACCISVFNKGGGVIVAEKDNSILPVVINNYIKQAAFVVGFKARHLWRHLILSFCKDCPTYSGIKELASNFIDYANRADIFAGNDNIGFCDGGLLLCGYEEEDIFPSVVRFGFSSSYSRSLKILEEQKVTFKNPAIIISLGDMNAISPVLWGVSSGIYDSCIKFYENSDEISGAQLFKEKLKHLNSDYHQSLITGIDTFDIQDIIDAGETLLNINLQLMRLSRGEEAGMASAREIAVLTKTEGITWIKHSIHAI